MLKPILALSLSAGLGLAGCASTGSITGTQVQSDLLAFEQAVQQSAILACGVEPTAASVAALLTQGNAAAAGVTVTASAVASLICKALVAQAPAMTASRRYRGSLVPAPVNVNGVIVSFEVPKASLRFRRHR